MSELLNLDPKTFKPPKTRIKDAASLNSIIKTIAEHDSVNAMNRADVQKAVDGAPPFEEGYVRASGQPDRCNLNFGDIKNRVKLEEAGFYDLTDSVPTLAVVLTDLGDPVTRSQHTGVMAEEWHRTLKEWDNFDLYHQLLVKKFCTHGIGVLYFTDDLDWRWSVAGLEDFKFPRMTTLSSDEMDIVVVFRDITVGKLYSWIKDVKDSDKRWNLMEVKKAILRAADGTALFADNLWEQWQAKAKNNDLFASATAQDTVHVAHAWVREFSGRISQFMTLKDGSNTDFLFKCEERFECAKQCFTIFPYEVGTNGLLHSVRGLAHEIYAQGQVLNDLRCQTVDNAKLSGSLLLQPASATAAEELALIFYGGAVYIPPGVSVQNGQLNNPSTNILPVIQDMSMLLRRNSGDVNTRSGDASQREKTKFEVQSELTKESVLPTASLNLFYQPWRRHLNEVARRFQSKSVTKTSAGGKEILEFRKRCLDRGVPEEMLYSFRVEPTRAIGAGSPSQRLLALEELLQYYGSLDPVGQNNLLRDRFAERVKYSMVDRYVAPLEQTGRVPIDVQIAELQNAVMSAGNPQPVIPNDNHLLHLQSHLPNLEAELTFIEDGEAGPESLRSVQIKAGHSAEHLKLLKPDKLQEKIVAEFNRQFNNLAQRVEAAVERAQKEAEAAAQQPDPSAKLQMDAEKHELKMQTREEDHQQKMRLREEAAAQKRAQLDAEKAVRLAAEAERNRLKEELTKRQKARE